MKQRSSQWHAIRCGKITASRIGDLMATLKSGKPAAAHRNYIAELVSETLTGESPDFYVSPAMQWGIDTEPRARSAYEFEKDVEVKEKGFAIHPEIDRGGASPDGLVGHKGLIEIKCPKTANHLKTLRKGKIKNKYILQMQWQMACTGREWCDFVSYDPRLPLNLSLYIKRVERDEEKIKEIESAVKGGLEEVDKIIEELEEV